MDHECRRDRLVVPSRLEEVARVERVILEAVDVYGYSSSDRFAIKLALEEAMANAIKHGNQSDPGKSVTVEYRVDVERVQITVIDEGPGFNREDVPDPTLSENLDKPYGRGVMLMNAYMNEVAYNQVGNCVTLVKMRSEAEEGGDSEGGKSK